MTAIPLKLAESFDPFQGGAGARLAAKESHGRPPVVKKKPFPTLERIGLITPDAAMVKRARAPSFEKGAFTHLAPILPEPLRLLLEEKGYVEDLTGPGMLFASKHGATMHKDNGLSVLWVLDLPPPRMYGKVHQLVVAGEAVTLLLGEVYFFDARKNHGVIAGCAGLWTVYSSYVKRLPRSRGKR